MSLFISPFKVFGWKCILDWIENSGLKSTILYCLTFQVYLMYKTPAHHHHIFMYVLNIFFQVFIVLGVYIFGREKMPQTLDFSSINHGSNSAGVRTTFVRRWLANVALNWASQTTGKLESQSERHRLMIILLLTLLMKAENIHHDVCCYWEYIYEHIEVIQNTYCS